MVGHIGTNKKNIPPQKRNREYDSAVYIKRNTNGIQTDEKMPNSENKSTQQNHIDSIFHVPDCWVTPSVGVDTRILRLPWWEHILGNLCRGGGVGVRKT